MSNYVEELRDLQLDIRLAQNRLAAINSEEKTHPKKTLPGDSHEKIQAWLPIKAGFDKRRRALKERYAKLEEQRLRIERAIDRNQGTMTKATLGHILTQLTEVEGKFTTDGNNDAWDSLTAFIDWLDGEAEKLGTPQLAAVA